MEKGTTGTSLDKLAARTYGPWRSQAEESEQSLKVKTRGIPIRDPGSTQRNQSNPAWKTAQMLHGENMNWNRPRCSVQKPLKSHSLGQGIPEDRNPQEPPRWCKLTFGGEGRKQHDPAWAPDLT